MRGKIVRRVVRARRRLDKMEWEQERECWLSVDELDMEEQSLMLPTGLEERMLALRIDKEEEQQNEPEPDPVEEAMSLMAGLQLMGAGIQP